MNIEWFMKRGKYYRRTPWKHVLLDKYLKGIVLDIGCGYASTTRYYFFMKKSITQLILLDMVGDVLEEIEHDKYLMKIVSDALTPPFNQNYFDTIYMQAFLHNIPGRECRIYILRKAWSLLRNSGVLIVTVWSPDLNILKKKYLVTEIGENDIVIVDKWGRRYYHIYNLEELISDVTEA
ncbi:MAG: methyltransferase domain-containing protein, partial [Staphylothermus sp.]|nr:methyltransferase domain-containing protein [Staphylothermus sp.]